MLKKFFGAFQLQTQEQKQIVLMLCTGFFMGVFLATYQVTADSLFLNRMGDKLDKEVPRTMPAGSFGYWAAGMKHMVWAKGETVVQLHGVGPWAIMYVDSADDPRNKRQ